MAAGQNVTQPRGWTTRLELRPARCCSQFHHPPTPAPAPIQCTCSIATVTPTMHIVGAHPSDSPMEQCLAVDAWLLLMIGIALPLAARAVLESGARAAFARQLRWRALQLSPRRGRSGGAAAREAASTAGRPGVSAVRQGSAIEPPPEPLPELEDDLKPVQPHMCWRLLFTSSGAWALSCLAAALWQRNRSD